MTIYVAASPGVPNLSFSSIYLKIWQGLVVMEKDPHTEVANMTKLLTEYIRNKVTSSFFHVNFIVLLLSSEFTAGQRNTSFQRS